MRRFWITLLAGATALAIVLPATATAGPPCDRLPDHSACQDPPPPTTTMAPSDTTCVGDPWDGEQVFDETNEFDIVVDARTVACIDWTTDSASKWHLTITPIDPTAKIAPNRIFMKVEDWRVESYLDRCWAVGGSLDGAPAEAVIAFQAGYNENSEVDLPLPASGVAACGGVGDNADPYMFIVANTHNRGPLSVIVEKVGE